MNTIDFIALVVGYIVMAGMFALVAFLILYVFYWCVIIPLHLSVMYRIAYKRHPNSEHWTESYKKAKFKILAIWVNQMKKPFNLHNSTLSGELITIDYTGRWPKTTIKK